MTTIATENTLDAQAMLSRAQAWTGLHDWSDATFPERFGLAVDQLNDYGLLGLQRHRHPPRFLYDSPGRWDYQS